MTAKILALSLAVLVSGCATCREHPRACVVAVAITAAALSADSGSSTPARRPIAH